jgi:hypothetical protein
VYFTTDERDRLLEELRKIVDPDSWTEFSRLYAHLNAPREESK